MTLPIELELFVRSVDSKSYSYYSTNSRSPNMSGCVTVHRQYVQIYIKRYQEIHQYKTGCLETNMKHQLIQASQFFSLRIRLGGLDVRVRASVETKKNWELTHDRSPGGLPIGFHDSTWGRTEPVPRVLLGRSTAGTEGGSGFLGNCDDHEFTSTGTLVQQS